MLSILLQSAFLLPQSLSGSNLDFESLLPTPQEAEEKNWSGTLDLGMTLISGNNESSNGAANLTWAWASGFHAIDLGAHYSGTRTTEPTTGDAYTTSRLYLYDGAYKRYFSEEQNLYLFGDASSREDLPNGLQARNAAGVGLGYTFHPSADATLDVEAGSSYVNENKVGTLANTTAVARAGYSFAMPLLEDMDFTGAGKYLKGTDIESYVQDFGLRWNFNGSWNIVAAYSIAWDGNPSAGFSSTDRRFNLTVGTSF